jgi:RNA polymerase sigma-70 factor (ECF subfamily)
MGYSSVRGRLADHGEHNRRSRTYASGTVSVSGRDSASESGRALSGFGTPKRNMQSVFRARASNFSDRVEKTHTEALGRQVLEEMFIASRSRFIAIAYSILRNREDAEDAVQDAFLLGHRHLRSFEGRSALRTWFTRIVLNAALRVQRKRKESTIKPLSEDSGSHEVDWTENIPASKPDPEMVHAERETLQFIDGILGKMKPLLRQAFTMTYFDELSSPEACALLGISCVTFKARLFRARQELLSRAQRALLAPIHKRTLVTSKFSQKCRRLQCLQDLKR